jgi:transcriptional regulator with XRE-family HTH domain
MDLKKAFGISLKRLRMMKGLSQEELALEIDMARSYISYLERGIKEPGLKTIFRLAKALGIKPSEFIHKVELRQNRTVPVKKS